jgi:alkaline phosphatase
MEPVAWRETPLAEMTWVALSKLSRNPQGFFLVVEGSQPDFYAHDNAPLPEIVAEVIDFDQAIEVALDFARSNPGTLVVVTSDHETGGLSLVEKDGRLKALYNTTDHTAEMVPIFASGPRARRFGGIKNNDEIGRMLIEIVRSRR